MIAVFIVLMEVLSILLFRKGRNDTNNFFLDIS